MFAMPDMKLFYNGFSYLPASRGKSKLPLKFDLTLARNCTRRCRRQLHPWPAVSSPQPIDLHRITPCPYLFLEVCDTKPTPVPFEEMCQVTWPTRYLAEFGKATWREAPKVSIRCGARRHPPLVGVALLRSLLRFHYVSRLLDCSTWGRGRRREEGGGELWGGWRSETWTENVH